MDGRYILTNIIYTCLFVLCLMKTTMLLVVSDDSQEIKSMLLLIPVLIKYK